MGKSARVRSSKLHLDIKKYLLENKIIKQKQFRSEQMLFEPGLFFIVDELDIKNRLILEIFGDFYHFNPKIYKKNDILIFPTSGKQIAKNIWKYDKMRIKKIKEKLYKIFIIWEYDWKCNPKKVIQNLKRWLRQNIKKVDKTI